MPQYGVFLDGIQAEMPSCVTERDRGVPEIMQPRPFIPAMVEKKVMKERPPRGGNHVQVFPAGQQIHHRRHVHAVRVPGAAAMVIEIGKGPEFPVIQYFTDFGVMHHLPPDA
jgi:hypothetical protein